MKRYLPLVAAMVALLVLSASLTTAAPFPKPDSSDIYALFQGWLDDDLVYFVGFETNNIRLATSILFADFIHANDLFSYNAYHYPQFTPKLTSALQVNPTTGLAAARPMYVVLNYQQGAILTTRPGNADYSGLWQIHYVQWLPGVTPRTIKNAAAPGTDPYGLPDPTEATITATDIVFNCPIIAIGRITQPIFPVPAGSYRIPQVLAFSQLGSPDTPPRWVRLPRYNVWYKDPITTKTWTARMPITDASSPELADMLKANLAPGLMNVPLSDTQEFWWFNFPYPVLCQQPLMSAGPSTSAAPIHSPVYDINKYYDYSPVMVYTVLDRNLPNYITVSSVQFLQLLLGSGALTVAETGERINGHASFISKSRQYGYGGGAVAGS